MGLSGTPNASRALADHRDHLEIRFKETEVDAWLGLGLLIKLKQRPVQDASRCQAEIENPVDEYLRKSTMWSCKNRRRLNCGSFSSGQRTLHSLNDSLVLGETALLQATKSQNESVENFAR